MNLIRERENFLIQMNARWLRQGVALLERMTGDDYRAPVAALAGQRVGPQIRHIVEFYESFLNGLQLRSIDYDARRRDPVIETSRLAAIARLREIEHRMTRGQELRGDCVVWVKIEDSPGGSFDFHPH